MGILSIQRIFAFAKLPSILVLGGLFLALSSMAFSAEAILETADTTNSSEWVWNLVIAVLVISVSAGSAALPLAASRQWAGKWRFSALAPIAVLILWVAIIVLGRLQSADSHQLWPFEIFTWAMLNMIYMVAVMTIKRVLDKADQEKSLSN
jgi:hypothetical protein